MHAYLKILLTAASLSGPLAAVRADVFFNDTPLPDVIDEPISAVRVSSTYFGSADYVDHSREEYSMRRHAFAGSYVRKNQTTTDFIAAGYELTHYDFQLSDDRDFHSFFATAGRAGMITENWAARGHLAIGTGAEDSANFDDGAWFGGGVLFQREWDNGLSFGIGLNAHDFAERGLQLQVPLTFKWRINERLRLELGNGAKLTYDVWGDQRTLLEVGYLSEYRHYRMRDFSEPNLRDLAVEELQHMAAVKLHHRFGEHASLFVMAGYTGDREITFWHNNAAVGAANGDQTWLFSIGFSYRF